MISTTPCNPQDLTVAVLLGGTSTEREVSLDSGAAAAKALRGEGFKVIEIDPATSPVVEQLLYAGPDVVFFALHGKDGEDGSMQGVCEMMGIPYTGSGVLGSALAMDKVRAKRVYEAEGLRTPDMVVLHAHDAYDIADLQASIGTKCAVKPAQAGSAFGISITETPDELQHAIETAFEHDSSVLVERCVEGTEVTIAVLGNDEIEALPVIEIVPQGESTFYDYDAKYQVGGAQHIIPARIDDGLTTECQSIALAAHRVLGCRGVSRSDLIIDNDDTCWLLETNTIPGLTETSLLPDAASKAGIPFPTLCRMLVELALEPKA
ncbi:MAG: D-alanine--D-alanine ligase [Coriobacteriaceae bacterium]|nr:D-alanine--D-alanine ligase [Coriobacteriaceae bacterium]